MGNCYFLLHGMKILPHFILSLLLIFLFVHMLHTQVKCNFKEINEDFCWRGLCADYLSYGPLSPALFVFSFFFAYARVLSNNSFLLMPSLFTKSNWIVIGHAAAVGWERSFPLLMCCAGLLTIAVPEFHVLWEYWVYSLLLLSHQRIQQKEDGNG